MTYLFNCFVTDVWREYTSYEVDLEEERTAEIDLNVINTAEMDVICAEAMALSNKGDVFSFISWFHVMLYFERQSAKIWSPSKGPYKAFIKTKMTFSLVSTVCLTTVRAT